MLGFGVVLLIAEAELAILQAKMDRGEYNNPLEFEYDMMLVWNNCMTYNQVRSPCHCVFTERWKLATEL